MRKPTSHEQRVFERAIDVLEKRLNESLSELSDVQQRLQRLTNARNRLHELQTSGLELEPAKREVRAS